MDVTINDFIGIPFCSRGRGEAGYDCWGLVRVARKALIGRDLPSLDDRYVDALDTVAIAALVDASVPELKAQKVDSPQTGDIVVMSYQGKACHVGMYVEPGKVLHTERGKESVLERISFINRRARIVGYYRVD